jgi:hypothetical protein
MESISRASGYDDVLATDRWGAFDVGAIAVAQSHLRMVEVVGTRDESQWHG